MTDVELARARFRSLESALGEGEHSVTLSVGTELGGSIVAQMWCEEVRDETSVSAQAFLMCLASALLPLNSGGLLARTYSGESMTVRAWRINWGEFVPLTAGEVFNASCTHPVTGDIDPPEPGVDYETAFPFPPR